MTIHAPRMAQDGDEGDKQSSISSRWGCRSGRRCSWVLGPADPARDRHRSCQDQNRGTDSEEGEPKWVLHIASVIRIGSLRIRFAVAANTAFAIAGAVHGTPGSPIPPDFSLLSTRWVSITGHSFMRSAGKV